MTHLRVHDVTVSFGATNILHGVDLDVGTAGGGTAGGGESDDGTSEVVALLGPSGSGKSTLLRVIAGILTPDRGSVWIDERDVTTVPTHRRGVGMVFQDNQLFPHRSTRDNVAFGLRMAGVERSSRAARADEWLDRVGLGGFGDRRVTELSGGEAKRVALARTLAPGPSIVLLDEPLTGLDRDLHDRLAVDLGALLRDAGATALLVTHDRDEAATVADRSVLLATLQQSDPTDEPNRR